MHVKGAGHTGPRSTTASQNKVITQEDNPIQEQGSSPYTVEQDQEGEQDQLIPRCQDQEE
jgi:hypothetical protein